MNTTDIQTAREVDARLAELQVARNKRIQLTSSAWKGLKRWNCTDLERARVHAKNNSAIRIKLETIETETPKIEAITAQMNEINRTEYTGWNRFFLVQHIHNTQYCSSFRWNTQIAWCPEISGLTEEDAVAEYGTTLCTICFKSAPTE